jgi:hypothetical protein
MNTQEHTPPAEKLRELEHVADVGESGETPFILMGEVWVVCATAVLVLLAIALLAYDLA